MPRRQNESYYTNKNDNTRFFFRLFHSFFCCCFNLINFQINGAGRIYYYSVFFFFSSKHRTGRDCEYMENRSFCHIDFVVVSVCFLFMWCTTLALVIAKIFLNQMKNDFMLCCFGIHANAGSFCFEYYAQPGVFSFRYACCIQSPVHVCWNNYGNHSVRVVHLFGFYSLFFLISNQLRVIF